MADYLASNFKVYQEYLKTRAAETLQQQADVFNAAVNNAIVMRTVEKPGDYEQESFFKDITSLITRRDNTSTSAATKLSMAMDEFIRVKLNRKIGPVDQSRDSFRKVYARYSEMEFAGILGGQIAVAQQLDMANASLLAVAAAQARLSLAGQAVTAEEREGQVVAAAVAARNQATFALNMQNKATNLAIMANLDLARAYGVSDAAAMVAAAHAQAAQEHLTTGVNVQARARQLLAQAVSGQVAGLSQDFAQQLRVAQATKAANDNVAAGTLAYDRASQAIQQHVEMLHLEELRKAAIQANDKAQLALIDQLKRAVRPGLGKDRGKLAGGWDALAGLEPFRCALFALDDDGAAHLPVPLARGWVFSQSRMAWFPPSAGLSSHTALRSSC